MTVAEFEKKYYLHDSSLTEFEFDTASRNLTLTIEFCFWMQNWYDKSAPKNGVIAVNFENNTGALNIVETAAENFIFAGRCGIIAENFLKGSAKVEIIQQSGGRIFGTGDDFQREYRWRRGNSQS